MIGFVVSCIALGVAVAAMVWCVWPDLRNKSGAS